MLKFKNIFAGIHLPFVAVWKRGLSVGFFLFFISVSAIFFKGLNFGLDFIGGYEIDLRIPKNSDKNLIESIAKEDAFKDIVLQRFFNSDDVSVKMTSFSDLKVSLLKKRINELYDGKVKFLGSDYIGSQFVGGQIAKSVWVIIFSVFAMLLYLWVRFDIFYGIGGLVSLVHDVVITLGFISLFNLEFDFSAMAALLTVVGYSVNDSVVIYDRIRDIASSCKKKISAETLEDAVNMTLSRTCLTSATTILSSVPVVVFCSGSVRTFCLIVLFGIFIGTLSSIFISAPVLLIRKFIVTSAV